MFSKCKRSRMESRNGVFGKEEARSVRSRCRERKRAGICLPWKVGGEAGGGEVLEAPAPQQRGVSALVKEQGCLRRARRALCQAGSLDTYFGQGMNPAPGTGKGSPRGERWDCGIGGQRTGWNPNWPDVLKFWSRCSFHVQS